MSNNENTTSDDKVNTLIKYASDYISQQVSLNWNKDLTQNEIEKIHKDMDEFLQKKIDSL